MTVKDLLTKITGGILDINVPAFLISAVATIVVAIIVFGLIVAAIFGFFANTIFPGITYLIEGVIAFIQAFFDLFYLL